MAAAAVVAVVNGSRARLSQPGGLWLVLSEAVCLCELGANLVSFGSVYAGVDGEVCCQWWRAWSASSSTWKA